MALLLIAVVSGAVVSLLSSVAPKPLRALWIFIVPFAVAYCYYWLPVWLGADPLEYDVWKFSIGIFFVAGFLPSAVLVLILQKRQAK